MSVAEQLRIARRALETGDAPHALRHLAEAFALLPNDERVHALFEEIAQVVDVLALLPEDHVTGTQLVRAFALRRAGRACEAIALLAQVAEVLLERNVETTLASWIVALGASDGRLDDAASRKIARLLAVAAESTIGIHRLLPGERALLSGFGEVARAARDCGIAPACSPIIAAMLRRIGSLDEVLALPVATEGELRELGLTQRGLALRASGDGARAAEMFAELVQSSPQDGRHAIEQARSLFVAGDFDGALALIALCHEHRADREIVALERACRDRASGDRVAVLDAIRRIPFDTRTPANATANLIRDHGAKFVPGSAAIKLSLDGWEPPSNRLLVALFTTATTDVRRAAYDAPATEIAGDAVDRRTGLWRRSDGIVEQAVPPPMLELRAAIGRIALEASDLDSTWRRAGALAAHLDPSLAPDVAASMVHPPVDANWIAALPDVLYRHQLAAACVLAQLRGGFSRTREVYERLVLGPVDWTSAAAIVSLGQVARRDPDDARNALGLLVLAVGDLLPHADEPRFIPLLEALHMLPCVPERVHRDRQAWYRKYLANR